MTRKPVVDSVNPSPAPLMLGVSGLRGIVGASVTPAVVTRFAGALGGWIRQQQAGGTKSNRSRPIVVVGRDGRQGGQMLYHAAIAGLTAAGCDVVAIGVAMTPTVGVAVDHYSAAAGLMVTASHNPQQWNGLKAMVRDRGAKKGATSASAPAASLAAQIIARFHAMPEPAPCEGHATIGDVCEAEALAAHVERALAATAALGKGVLAAIKKAKPLVVVDSVGGSGTQAGPAFAEQLGCRAMAMYDTIGRFPHTPEPTRENLVALCAAVKKHKAAVGFAQDPDADRLAIVDEKGRYIGEEYTLVLAARALFELGGPFRKPTVAVNLSTSRMIDDLAAKHGARVIRTAVGEANVVEAMKHNRCVIGGEGNGGVIHPGVTYIRDSLTAMGLVLALLARTKRPLSALVDEMPSYAIVKQKVDLARKEDAAPTLKAIAAAYAPGRAGTGVRIDTQDGIRLDFDARSAWVHVRASNTEPIMRLIAEAPTAAEATHLLGEVAAAGRDG